MSNERKEELKAQIKKTVLEKLNEQLDNDKLSLEELEKLEGGFSTLSNFDAPVTDGHNVSCPNYIC